MPRVRIHLPYALRNREVRRACAAVEAVMEAGDRLDSLPPDVLEQVSDYCTEYIKGHPKNAFSEFKSAYINLVVDHMRDAKLRERRLYYGITGKAADMGDHELPPWPKKKDED